jgi:hypothetical protein
MLHILALHEESVSIRLCWRRSERQSLRRAPAVVLSVAARTVRNLAQKLGFLQTSRTVVPDARMIRSCAEATEFANNIWILLLRGTPSGRRGHKVCLEIDRLPKMSLNDIESERGEDYREKTVLLSTTRAKCKKRKIY